MKKKFFNTLTIIGLAFFLLILVLNLYGIVSFFTLWVKYVLILSLLTLFIGLSSNFKKFTDYNEGIACLKRALKTMNNIKNRNIQKINYVRLLSIENQLNNANIYIANVVDNFDLHELKSNLVQLKKIENHYSIDTKSALTNDLIDQDIKFVSDTYENIKDIKSRNELIK